MRLTRAFRFRFAQPSPSSAPAVASRTRRRSSRHRICKRDILWLLGFFIAAQVILAIWIEQRRPELRSPEYGRKLHDLKAAIAKGPIRPLFLALGSSRTLNGLRPEAIPPLAAPGHTEPLYYNFGLTAHSALHQLALFNRLWNEGIRPKWMLIEVTPSFLPIEVNASKMVQAESQEWSDLPVLMRYESWPFRMYTAWLDARVMPWSSHRFAIQHHYAPRWVPHTYTQFKTLDRMSPLGFLPLPKPKDEKDKEKKFEAAEKDHKAVLQQFNVSLLSQRALRELLDRCRDEEISVALVLTPEGSAFRSWYGPGANEKLQTFLNELQTDYGVQVFDARDWVNDELFWDGHHLLPDGADIFTKRLSRDAIAELLKIRHD